MNLLLIEKAVGKEHDELQNLEHKLNEINQAYDISIQGYQTNLRQLEQQVSTLTERNQLLEQQLKARNRRKRPGGQEPTEQRETPGSP